MAVFFHQGLKKFKFLENCERFFLKKLGKITNILNLKVLEKIKTLITLEGDWVGIYTKTM